jgi:hypothetical protein
MKMENAFVNYDEGFACCCWTAPTLNELRQLFVRAGAPFDRIVQVEEMTAG